MIGVVDTVRIIEGSVVVGANSIRVSAFSKTLEIEWDRMYVNMYTGIPIYLKLAEEAEYVHIGIPADRIVSTTFSDPWGGDNISGHPKGWQ